MDKALAELIRISNIVGKDTRLVQGGGGNTSAKTEDGKFMFIKASGTALKDMSENKGWRRMRLADVVEVISDNKLAKKTANVRETEVVNRLLNACDDGVKDGSRPSVEAHLHSILDKFVIHLHPEVVGSYVNAKNGQSRIAKIFGKEKYPPLWVPYFDPGFMLGNKIAGLVEKYKQTYRRAPQVLFLDKHGLFVTADSANAALRLTKRVIKMCEDNLTSVRGGQFAKLSGEPINDVKLALRSAIFSASGKRVMVGHFINDAVAAFMKRKDAARLLAAPSLTPDELVYANGAAMWIENTDIASLTKKIARRIQKENK